MNVSQDLIHIKSLGSELYIMDQGYIGIKFLLLRPDGQWSSTNCSPHELSPLIEKLTEFRDRNIKVGMK